jgi:hypothetical protein
MSAGSGLAGRGSGLFEGEGWVAAGLFGVLTLVLTYPLSIHPGSTSLLNDPDVHTYTWTLAWDAHALVTRPWAIFDANIFYPYTRTLAFSENLIGSALIAAPVIWLSGNPVLALNTVALLSVALCGVGAFVLGRRLGMGIAAAIVCGLVFAFSPARFYRLGQTHLTTIQWIPFALAALVAYLNGSRRSDLWMAIGLFSLQALTSGHGAVYLTIAASGLVLFRVATGMPLRVSARLRDLGVPGVALMLPALLLIPPYFLVQREMGLRRSLENWAPAAVSFLASPTHLHQWLMARLTDVPVNTQASAFMFPGWLPLALALLALLPGRAQVPRRDVVFFAALTGVALLLSAGPPLGLWPFVYWLPGFSFIRIPSRFILLAVLALAVVAGAGVDRIVSRVVTARARVAVASVVVAVLIAEFWAAPLPVQPYRVEIPSLDRWLDAQPKPFAVAEVPVGPFVRYHSTYMLHSMAHWQRTVHGHSSLLTPLHEQLYDRLRSFPDEASIAQLHELGVTYLIVHRDWYEREVWTGVEERLRAFSDRLTLLHEEIGGRIYRLTAK